MERRICLLGNITKMQRDIYCEQSLTIFKNLWKKLDEM